LAVRTDAEPSAGAAQAGGERGEKDEHSKELTQKSPQQQKPEPAKGEHFSVRLESPQQPLPGTERRREEAVATVQQFLSMAQSLLPSESPQAEPETQQGLREQLKESWAGKVRPLILSRARCTIALMRPLPAQTYYERLEAIVDQSPAAKRPRAAGASKVACPSPMTRAAMAAAALDDDIDQHEEVGMNPARCADENMHAADIAHQRAAMDGCAKQEVAVQPTSTELQQRIAVLEAEATARAEAHDRMVRSLGAAEAQVSVLKKELAALRSAVSNAVKDSSAVMTALAALAQTPAQ
jgi:hypothetical protein